MIMMRMSETSYLLLLWTYFAPSSSVSIADFKQVNVSCARGGVLRKGWKILQNL